MGGLPRRATYIAQEKATEPESLILDSGNFVTDRPLAEPSLDAVNARTRLLLGAMERMGYAAAAIGEKDLNLGLDRLLTFSGATRVRFLSANLTDDKGKTWFDPYLVARVGGISVGIIGLTGTPSDSRLLEQRAPGARIADPLQAARKTVKEIREKCGLVVVLSNIGYSRDLELASSVPGIDIIVSGGTKRFMRRPLIQGRTLITSGYYEGRAVGRLAVQVDGPGKGWISKEEIQFMDKQISEAEAGAGTPEGKAKHDALLEKRSAVRELTVYEPDMVNLDPSYPDDPQVVGMISDYRKELKSTAAGSAAPAGFQDAQQVRYTGAEACGRCHEARYRFWQTTPHSEAFGALAPKEAEADPDCIGCHVTGYMRRTGYWPKAPREDLRGVQCEACHGVGSLHIQDPQLYSLLHLPAAPQCMDCHTQNQDEDFDYFRDRSLVCSEAIH